MGEAGGALLLRRYIPLHTVTYRYIPVHTVTYRYTPSHAVAGGQGGRWPRLHRRARRGDCIPLPTVTSRYMPLQVGRAGGGPVSTAALDEEVSHLARAIASIFTEPYTRLSQKALGRGSVVKRPSVSRPFVDCCRYIPLHTVPYRHIPSPTVACRHR